MRITIAEAGKHVGETVEIAGWLYNLRSGGKICFPQVRDGSGIMQCVAVKSALPEELFESLKHLTQESSLIVRGKIRAEPRAPGGFEMDLETRGDRAARARVRSLSHHAQRARHRFPDGPSPSVAAQPPPARGPAGPPRGDQGDSRLLRFARLHPGGHADLHARRVRRHHHAVRGRLLRRRKGLSGAIRPALRRGDCGGLRQDLLLRPGVSRRKIQNPPPPDGILDGGAGDGLRRSRRRQTRRRRVDPARHRPRSGASPRGIESPGARRLEARSGEGVRSIA